MSYICDFHIHSKFSRATSPDMDIPLLSRWAKIKGVSLLGTGDFTFSLWLKRLKDLLSNSGSGIYEYEGVDFILTAEVSNIYRRYGRLRKVHNIIFAPEFNAAQEINQRLSRYGKLESDGRPILKLDSESMVRIFREIDERIFVVPAHIWTPHFSVLGANSGFDSIEECFGDMTEYIYALETGLSSDPPMNYMLSGLDKFLLISNSDCHSPSRIGREANCFASPLDFQELLRVLKERDTSVFESTIEFYPEEGKYHYDGHRKCGVSMSPWTSRRENNVCPKCGKMITVGVLHRVCDLADRENGFIPPSRPGHINLIPLVEIISHVRGVGVNSKRVKAEYDRIISAIGTEFRVLTEASRSEIEDAADASIAGAVLNVRENEVTLVPGYDGEYGKVIIRREKETVPGKERSLFDGL